jgi:hypothetical protein
MKPWMRPVFLMLAVLFSLSCERDDICIDEITPKLIIRFYDFENPELFKDVANLKVNIEGTDGDYINETITTLTDSIALPINVVVNETRYTLTLQENDILQQEENADILEITYTQEDIWVSRPCGYKAVFNGVESRLEKDEDNWIDEIVPLSDPLDITNENSAHVKIYH